MTAYLIPTDDAIVEDIAKSIAKNRLRRDSAAAIESIVGARGIEASRLEDSVDRVFEMLWNGTSEVDEMQRSGYRDDALAAIRTINLKLITTTY